MSIAYAQDDEGVTLFKRNLYHKALARLPSSPTDAETRYLLGLCYFKLGLMYMGIQQVFLPLSLDYYEELHALPERISEQARPSIYTPYYLGLTYLEVGDYARGIAALTQFLEKSPPFPKGGRGDFAPPLEKGKSPPAPPLEKGGKGGFSSNGRPGMAVLSFHGLRHVPTRLPPATCVSFLSADWRFHSSYELLEIPHVTQSVRFRYAGFVTLRYSTQVATQSGGL
jgi:hypothetical protein